MKAKAVYGALCRRRLLQNKKLLLKSRRETER